MPVENHEVHPSTQHTDLRYTACQNKRRMIGYFVPTRHFNPKGTIELRNTFVASATSDACRYTERENDPGCAGCKQPVDHEYLDRMKGLK